MPVLGLGTWELMDDTAGTVEEAFRLGFRMIDTSADYGTQEGIGEAVRKSNLPRDEIYLVTKVEEDEDGYEATQKNLEEIGQDYSDLVLIHRPPERGAGVDLWERLIKTHADGFARDVGVSNFSVAQIRTLIEETGETPAVNQIEWTPFGHDQEMLEFCRENDIVIQAYSPLTRAERLDDQRLVDLASKYDRSPAQLLIRWNLQLGTVPLPKANDHGHLREDVDVFDFEIEENHMQELNALNEQYSALSSLQYL
jgi:2,5-diketo-D-gluconate reductase A